MKPQIIAMAARAGNILESAIGVLRNGRARRAPRQLRIITYRSIGSSTSLIVRGRVVRQAETSERVLSDGMTPAHAHLVSVYRAFDAEDVPGATVRVTAFGITSDASAESGGFFEVKIPSIGNGWEPGWHEARVESGDASGLCPAATANIFVPDVRARLMIVSDLDDTAMDTETTSSWRMLRTVLLRSAKRRRPVPGVPELYRALHSGTTGVTNPFCYISSGAWNLYDSVVDYLDTHGLPRGGMLMNDWGSRSRGFREVTHKHKSIHLLDLVRGYPTQSLLLIGDDTQEDPELYAHVARAHTGRVAAIWIRAVRRDRSRGEVVRQLGQDVVSAGTEFVYAAETAEFAECARRRGWM